MQGQLGLNRQRSEVRQRLVLHATKASGRARQQRTAIRAAGSADTELRAVRNREGMSGREGPTNSFGAHEKERQSESLTLLFSVISPTLSVTSKEGGGLGKIEMPWRGERVQF